jgi:hypothetical protein
MLSAGFEPAAKGHVGCRRFVLPDPADAAESQPGKTSAFRSHRFIREMICDESLLNERL